MEAVSKRYVRDGREVVALPPCSLEVKAGDFVAVVGPSGSGKSTLLSVLGGMLAPTSGEVWLDGRPLYSLSVTERTRLRRRKIGFVFQAFNLVPYLTALENVQVPLYLAGRPPAEQRRRALALLEQVGLADRQEHRPGELSAGQQQRVALARTLANDPALILADEPTGNLDPDTREQVLNLLESFHRGGRTVVMVTHDPVAAWRARSTWQLGSQTIVAGDAETRSASAA
jgi:putative ABC transport system ATP-binding protein